MTTVTNGSVHVAMSSSDRTAIFRRKRRVMVGAMSSLAGVLLLSGCGGADTTSSASLSTSIESATTTTVAAPTTPLLDRRAGNGEVVQQAGLVGWGSLQINNGTTSDYAVVVTNGDPATPRATIYVQHGSEATLDGIDGTYFVYLKSGRDWDPATLGFTRSQEYQKFDDPFDAGSDWEISLQPSIGGNASTSDVGAF